MTAKAILRVEKLKSFGNVGGSEAHTARQQDTPNADPTRTNIRLIGNPLDPALSELVQTKISQSTKHKPRKDAVLCSEIFLSASPEYFRPNDPTIAGEWDSQGDSGTIANCTENATQSQRLEFRTLREVAAERKTAICSEDLRDKSTIDSMGVARSGSDRSIADFTPIDLWLRVIFDKLAARAVENNPLEAGMFHVSRIMSPSIFLFNNNLDVLTA